MILALGALVLGPAAVGANANSLESVGVSRDGDSIVVTIATTEGCEYNAFLTDSKPERIVVDLTGVVNNLDQKQFRQLPLHSIQSIRTSQFKSDPELQTRVVLDIERPIEFRSYKSDNNIVVKLPAIADEIEFAAWYYPGNEAPVQPAVEPAVEPEEVRVVESKPEEVAPIVETAPEEITPVVESTPEETTPVVESKPEEITQVAETTPEEIAPEEQPAVETMPVEVEAESLMPPKLAVANPSTPPGVQVDTTPKRQLVEYASMGLKDPFAPLVGAGSGRISEGLPSLENLKLVGILSDPETSRALLEDAEGNGYMLKPSDKIKGGYLVSVTDNKAIFQVTEYGWTRTVALELAIPEIR
jgi:hypothetical protein